jgi:hypothetical protein
LRIVAFVSALLLALTTQATAGTVVRPFNYTPGATIFSSQVNQNETTLYNLVNGNIDMANVGALGFQAAQILPTTSAQAIFGGVAGITYTMPFPFVVSGPLTANSLALTTPLSLLNGGLGNTSGTAVNVSGTVAANHGGTGLTAAGANGNILTSNGTGWASVAPTVVTGFVDLTTAQTINGAKTFSVAPASSNGYTSGGSSYGLNSVTNAMAANLVSVASLTASQCIATDASKNLVSTGAPCGSGSGSVAAVTGSGNIASSGGSSPNITFTGVLSVANGGTGTGTLNFVDTSSAQSVSGVKTFNNAIQLNGTAAGAATSVSIANDGAANDGLTVNTLTGSSGVRFATQGVLNGAAVTAAGGIVGASGSFTAALPASSGGTGIKTVGASGNVLTSNGTAWTSAASPGLTVVNHTNTAVTGVTLLLDTVTFAGTANSFITFSAGIWTNSQSYACFGTGSNSNQGFYFNNGSATATSINTVNSASITGTQPYACIGK